MKIYFEKLNNKALFSLTFKIFYLWIVDGIPGVFVTWWSHYCRILLKFLFFIKMENYLKNVQLIFEYWLSTTLKTTTILQTYWHAQIQTHVLFSKAFISKTVKTPYIPSNSLLYVQKSFTNYNKNYMFVIGKNWSFW